MSRHNKVNPDHYTQAGRLSPDDLAREWRQQRDAGAVGARRQKRKARPPWMADETRSGGPQAVEGRHDRAAEDDVLDEGTELAGEDDDRGPDDERGRNATQGLPRRRAAKTTAAKKTAGRKGNRAAPRRKQTGEPAGRATRKTTKAAGAAKTPKTKKAPRSRGSAARAASPQRAGRPRAHKQASRGTQKKTGQKGAPSVTKKNAPKNKKR